MDLKSDTFLLLNESSVFAVKTQNILQTTHMSVWV